MSADELHDLRDWLPYSPESTVEITVVDHTPTRTYLHQSSLKGTARYDQRRALALREGVTWIRGHHDESSLEGQALIAAHALDRSAA